MLGYGSNGFDLDTDTLCMVKVTKNEAQVHECLNEKKKLKQNKTNNKKLPQKYSRTPFPRKKANISALLNLLKIDVFAKNKNPTRSVWKGK